MFCTKCGKSNSTDAHYCFSCGAEIKVDGETTRTPTTDKRNPIWNPNAAANWSLMFTPAFGSYLQMRNWESLGMPKQAAAAKVWFQASLGFLGLYVLLGILMADPEKAEGITRGLALIFLLVWYFAVGRDQAKYVKATFATDYPRKPWGRALLIALGCCVGYFVAAFVVGIASAASGLTN